MSPLRLIVRSFTHYLSQNIWVSVGFAVATAIVTGSLIVGDSMRHSLNLTVDYRLGGITHTVTAGDRLFTRTLAEGLSQQLAVPASAAMKLDGNATVAGGAVRLNRIQILGVDSLFGRVMGVTFPYQSLGPGEAVISSNMAERMGLDTNDFFQLSMTRASLMPLNTPFVSDANQTISRRVRIKAIASDKEYGRFNLQVSQTPPYNVFVNLEWLNNTMELNQRANIILLSEFKEGRAEILDGIQRAWSLRDANLTLDYLEATNEWELKSDRVFIQEAVTQTLTDLYPDASQHLTYFVNSLELGSKLTPYSFVAADNRYNLANNEIIINQWLANDLNAQKGDIIYTTYFEIGPLRELTTRETSLTVKGILSMSEVTHDRSLTPHIPGLSDAGSCTEWEAGIPIDLATIRSKDEKYWDDYRGTPKAYISLSMGQKLWSNRFGNLTSIRIPTTKGSEASVQKTITSAIQPSSIGFQANEVRASGLEAVSNAVDFTELFIGLSFFVIVSGVVLSLLLLLFNLRSRSSQMELFASLGYSKKLVRFIFLGEGMLITIAGALLGVGLAVIYSRMVFNGLNRVWHGIVRTNLLEISIEPASLLLGFAISLAISFTFVLLAVSRHISGRGRSIITIPKRRVWVRIRYISAFTLTTMGISVVLPQVWQGDMTNPNSFFISGVLLLVAYLTLTYQWLISISSSPSQRVSLLRLSIRNLVRNRGRSFSTIVLLTLGVFVVISTGANRKAIAPTTGNPSDGTGGFALFAEATVPFLHNLNSPEQRRLLDLPTSLNAVQMSAAYDDDASCLNLNQVANPRILGVNPTDFQGRFTFTNLIDPDPNLDPWLALNRSEGFVIPAIADQTVIQWGLGKRIGDTLTYTNEYGREIHLRLIGGLSNSIFQGNVLISKDNLLTHFPSTSGSQVFLIDCKPEHAQEVGLSLSFQLRDYGWSMEPTGVRLARFNSIENTYLSIFLAMGAIGLMIGTIGLALVLALNVLERRKEFAMLLAQGFSKQSISLMLFIENTLLLFLGAIGGGLTAVISILPSLTATGSHVSIAQTTVLLLAIILHGTIWIILSAAVILRSRSIRAHLSDD